MNETVFTNTKGHKNNKTGRVFGVEVSSELKKGRICLACGIYLGRSEYCDTCKQFQKCKLCGILCRPEKKRLSYRYKKFVRKGAKVWYEYTIRRKNLCNELLDGFCLSCKNWEDLIKNRCWICKSNFPNHFEYYKFNGNACYKCCNFKEEVCIIPESTDN